MKITNEEWDVILARRERKIKEAEEAAKKKADEAARAAFRALPICSDCTGDGGRYWEAPVYGGRQTEWSTCSACSGKGRVSAAQRRKQDESNLAEAEAAVKHFRKKLKAK